MTTIILKKEYGQLGNRLHTHANILAWCIEKNINLINLSFSPYANYFKGTSNNPSDRYLENSLLLKFLLRIPAIHRFLNRLALSDRYIQKLNSFIILIHKKEQECLTELELENSLNNNFFCTIVIRAWDIQCPSLLEKHKNKVFNLLEPNLSIIEGVDKLKESFPNHDFLVGVHARRGDYASWLGGEHFHSWSKYIEWILQTQILLEEMGKKPAFLLCSDETPPKKLFSELPIFIHIGSRSLAFDLHALSTCDLILGPPSSFSSWAAFYGNSPKINLNSGENIQSLPIRQTS